MAYIRVVYKAKKAIFDYVDSNLLDALISQDEISHFFRSSEKRWISTKFDAIREGRIESYQGPERRRNQNILGSKVQEQEETVLNSEGEGTKWLEILWKDIESS